ncbi:hypothetical protein L195_g059373 [Trifolium pratense]|uniref:Uncharacterized protein n=1 Tax=Trifolium pratense TaxID=57577 RepID=A0A2K3JXM4_TRIPR|nr:hypothetical protein L195_g059373 [Trifolium pratense]
MASPNSRIIFRILMLTLLILVLFYTARPLYWKISATVHDVRNNKQTVRQGTSPQPLDARTDPRTTLGGPVGN